MLKRSSRVMCYPVTSCSHTLEGVRTSTVGSAVNRFAHTKSLTSFLASPQPPPCTINCYLRPRAYLELCKEILSLTPIRKKITWSNWNHCHFINNCIHWMFYITHVYKVKIKIMWAKCCLYA